MCVIKKFGYGSSLRQGAITAAILNCIVGFCTIITGAVYVKIADASLKHKPGEDINILAATRTISGVVLATGLISLIISIFLVVGVVKEMKDFIIAWLIGSIIYIVMSLFFIFYGMIMGLYLMIGSIFVIAFYIYLWIVVLNYYRELRDGLPSCTPEIRLKFSV